MNVTTDWKQILNNDLLSEIFLYLEKGKYFPSDQNIFLAFNHFNINELKIIILGQDCYHNLNQANGLAFSVNEDIKTPPSLKNILKELNNNYKINRINTDFTDLAKQGILFMNCALTVEPHKPGSHIKLWEEYTNNIIKYISNNSKEIIFVLWGGFAKKKKKFIDLDKHIILEANHPSPLSANRGGWFGCEHFIKINNHLKILNKKEIIWN
jgi:uracil-DNA glycosylase